MIAVKNHVIEMNAFFNVAPDTLYAMWLDSKGHEELTGGEADIAAELGYSFTAWDGYIEGEITGLEEGVKVVQTWRTSEFDPTHEDSILEVGFIPENGGTRFTLNHKNLFSEAEVEKYTLGWQDHYFQPMSELFNQ